MQFIPSNKSDLKACETLYYFANEEIEPYIDMLLEWVQDINWPVAMPIIERLKKAENEAACPIQDILQGDDAIWKYVVLKYLVIDFKSETVSILEPEIRRIAESPLVNEREEEVEIVAKQVLAKHQVKI